MNNAQITNKWGRLSVRLEGERRAQRAMVQLVCAVSILRTGLTAVVPLVGGASWWVLLVCLLPGLAVYAALALLLHRTRSGSLVSLLGRCLGRRGSAAACALGGALMLGEAAASLTALMTAFTQGLGASGTRWSLALLTCGALAAALHGEGLPRAVVVLRRVLTAGAVAALALSVQRLRADALFPMMGAGGPSVWVALRTGWGIGWPLVFLLAVPEESPRQRLNAPCPVVLTALAVVLFVQLISPHEVLVQTRSLADCLLLPAHDAPSALRMLARCLLMLGFFLSIAGNVLLTAEGVKACVAWPKIPWAILAVVALSQALDAGALWRGIMRVQPWLLIPGIALVILCGVMPVFRRWMK